MVKNRTTIRNSLDIRHLMSKFTKAEYCFFLAGLILLVLYGCIIPPNLSGDGHQYLYMANSFFNHGSPDLRQEDLGNNQLKAPQGNYYMGFSRTAKGRYFSEHFWIYSLFTIPVKFFYHAVGGNELAAFQVTNALLFLFALYLVLFKLKVSTRKRVILASFSALGSVLLYLRWTGPEVYSWSFVLAGIVFLNNRNYQWATFCVALSSMQNPPLMFFAAAVVLISTREKDFSLTLRTFGIFLLSFLPNVFYLAYFGVPNLIVERGAASFEYFSLFRVWEFLFDLNQGMFPFVPGLLILGGMASVYAIRQKNLIGISTIILIFLMICACCTTRNWNPGTLGVLRYAIWMMPFFAWMVAEFVPNNRVYNGLILIFVSLHLLIFIYYSRFTTRDMYLQQSPLASYILSKAPLLYSPSYEIFAERQCGTEDVRYYPIPFVTKDKVVTKILTDQDSLLRVKEWFSLDQGYYETLKQDSVRKTGRYYITPPYGTIRIAALPADSAVPSQREFVDSIIMEAVKIPTVSTQPRCVASIRITNCGQFRYWGQGSGSAQRLFLSYRIFKDDHLHLSARQPTAIPYLFEKKQSLHIQIPVELPGHPGKYLLEIFNKLQQVGEGKNNLRFVVEVSAAYKGKYLVSITPL